MKYTVLVSDNMFKHSRGDIKEKVNMCSYPQMKIGKNSGTYIDLK